MCKVFAHSPAVLEFLLMPSEKVDDNQDGLPVHKRNRWGRYGQSTGGMVQRAGKVAAVCKKDEDEIFFE
jgi:hypothetical protein